MTAPIAAIGCQPRRKHAVLVALLLFSCYTYFIPRSGRTDWAASGRADLVLAVADRGTLSIDAYHENTGDKALYHGRYYSVGSIGPSLLALPAYWVLKPALDFAPVARYLQRRFDLRGEVPLAPGAHRTATPRERIALIWMTLFAVSLPSAALGAFVYVFACRFVARQSHALILALTYGLGTVAFPYSKALFQHQTSALGAFVGFYLLWRVAREGADRWRLWVAGGLFGLAAISEYPVALFLVLLVGWAALEMADWPALHRVIWGALPLLLLFAAYNWVIFETPLPVAYRYHATYAEVHQQGFMGFTGPTWEALSGITVSPYRGLFFLSPVLLLTFPGLARLWRTSHERQLALLLGGILIGFVVYVASYLYWSGGDAIGPRFLVPAVPFMMLAMAPAFSSWWDRPAARWALGALIGVSVLNVWAQSVGGQYYPPYEWGGRIITNPTFQYSLPLLWRGDVAENYGTLLGLRGLASLFPLALIATGLVLTLGTSNARSSLRTPPPPSFIRSLFDVSSTWLRRTSLADGARLAEFALWLTAVGGIASVSLIVFAHLNDTYHIDHVAGAWLGLAKYVGSGVVYPPLYDGTHFGGTRYMPLQFLLYGLVGRLSGDYLAAAKALSAFTVALLMLVLYRLIRQRGCSRGMTVGLLATVAVSFPGLFAATSTYGDALAVLLQLVAVAFVARSTEPVALTAAAGFCAFALLTKFSAVWAPAAIVVWLLLRQPRRALTFAAEYLVLAAVSVWLLELVSDGRLSVNLRELAFSGLSSGATPFIEVPHKLYDIVRHRAVVQLFVVPIALASIVRETVERRPSIYTLSWAFALSLLLFVLADEGTDFNHLLDIIALTAVCAGEFVTRTQSGRHGTPIVAAAALVIVAGVIASYRANVLEDTRVAAASVIGHRRDERYNRELMSRFIAPDENLLSEDASLPLLLDRPPIVLDAFMLKRLGDNHAAWRADLVDRLNQHRFEKIVLIFKLDLADPWWLQSHFGAQVAGAIDCNYHLVREVLGGVFKYRIYVPGREPDRKGCPTLLRDVIR